MKLKLISPLGGTLNAELAINDEAVESEVISAMKHEILVQDLIDLLKVLQTSSTTETLASSLSHFIDADKFYNGREIVVEKE